MTGCRKLPKIKIFESNKKALKMVKNVIMESNLGAKERSWPTEENGTKKASKNCLTKPMITPVRGGGVRRTNIY